MAEYNKRPVVFALSNPVSQAECTFEEAIEGTNGAVLYASGSPFDKVEFHGKKYEPGQGNNLYIFPALGLGAILARVKTVSSRLLEKTGESCTDFDPLLIHRSRKRWFMLVHKVSPIR